MVGSQGMVERQLLVSVSGWSGAETQIEDHMVGSSRKARAYSTPMCRRRKFRFWQ